MRFRSEQVARRVIFKSIATLVLPIVAVVVASALTTAVSAAPLRIVLFNTQCLQAPDSRATRIPRFRWYQARQEHLEKVATVIETLRPDVICLVEVTAKDAVDAVVAILHEKGLDDYAGYHVESADGFTGFDVAFISRHKPDEIAGQPIRLIFSPDGDDTWRAKYSFVDASGQRQDRETGLMRHALFCVTIGQSRLGFLGLHLKSNPDDVYSNARRTAEAQIVQRIVNREIVARGYLPVLLGDLNDYDPDVPDRDETRSTQTEVLRMLKDYDPQHPGPELVNAAVKIQRMADRYTSHWDRNENGAADPDDVFTMIDYVLLPKPLMPGLQRTFVCRLTDLRTSDHWPVVVDLDLPEKSHAATQSAPSPHD